MYLLFDIGGTRTRLAVSQDGKKLENITVFDTLQSFEEGIERIYEQMHIISKGKKFNAIAGGVAGPLNQDESRLINAPNLKNWVQKPLKEELQKRLKAPVYLENDAALAGLGEATYGAGKDFGIVVYVTVSTGVGGARIVDEKIDRNVMGFEPGHQIIDLEGTTLEAYISGEALKRKYGKSAENIDDPDIWDDVAKKLAIGLNNLSVIWSPDIIVLGGSVMEKISLDATKGYLKKYLNIFPQSPKLELAALGDSGGLYGALSMIQNI